MKIYQIDVKSEFLNVLIQEEVYVEQPFGFESDTFPKLNKVMYGLKQAPRAWFEKLSSFILENSFERRKVDTTMFHKKL